MLDGFFCCNAQWQFVHINTTAERILGVSRQDILGKSHWEVFPQTLGTKLEMEYRLAAAGEIRDFENFHAPWQRWFHNRCIPRQQGGMAVYFREITSRKQMEERLYASEQRFRALTVASADVVYCMSPDWREMKHLQGKDFIADTNTPNRSWLEKYIHQDDQDAVLAVINEAIRTKSTFEMEHRVLRVDGSLGWTSSRAIPLLDDHDNIIEWFGAASDITVRKQAEMAAKLLTNHLKQQVADGELELEQAIMALQASEQRYRSVVEDQTELIFRYRADDHTYTFVNERFCQFFGKTKHELVGRSWQPEAFAEDIPMTLAMLESLSPATPTVTIENRVHDSMGAVRWLQINNRGIFNEEGQLVEIQGVGRDITRRKHLEEQLQINEEKFRSLVETTSECIWEMDKFGRFTYLSPKFEEITGYSVANFLGKPVADLLPPDSEYLSQESISDLIKQPMFTIETAAQHQNGRSYRVEVSGVPVFDSSGEILGMRGITRDITDRWILSKALRDSQARYRAIFENEITAIFIYDSMADRFVDINNSFVKLYGYSREEVLRNLSLLNCSAEPDKTVQSIADAVTKGTVFLPLRYHRKKDGSVFPVEIFAGTAEDCGRKVIYAMVHDITLRRQFECEREQYFRLFNTSADLMCIADVKQGYFKKINPAGIEMLGYSEEELHKRPFLDFIHPDDRQKTLDEAAQQLKIGITLNFENRYLRKDGTICWLSWRGSVDKEQRLTYATARDITEYKRLISALALQEEHFRKLFEQHSSIMLLVNSSTGTIEDVNFAASEFHGYSREQMRGMSISQIACEDKNEIADILHNVDHQGLRQFIAQHRLADGTIRTVEVNVTPISYAGNTVNFAIINDITERVLGEKRLRQAEAYARSLIEVNLDPLATIDAEGKINDVNEASTLATGYSREEMIGTDFSSYFTEPEKARTGYQQVFANSIVRDYPLAIHHRDGGVTPVIYNATLFKNEDKEIVGVFAAARDITQLKQAEEQLKELNTQLEQRVEERTRELQESQKQVLHAEKLSAIGMLSASIAHEFNNPLQGIMMILKSLKKRAKLDADEKELVGAAISESERIKNLILSLQEFNRPSSGHKTMLNTHQVLDSLLLLLKKALTSKQIQIERNYADNLPSFLAVPDQIKQVFLNLLTNASDACSDRRNATITISTWQDGDNIAVMVKDTGMGIKPENMDRIFQPFFSTKETVKGTGLGLSVSYGIVQAHGGKICVESRQGEGAAFTVYLPIQGSK
jgi:PAS domain S-box-containing protein